MAMYTYPEALSAMESIIRDLFARAGWKHVTVTVVADSVTGTASVDWYGDGQTTYPMSHVTVNMPVRPAQYRMTAIEFEHYAAYVIHEVGHPLWTSKRVWGNAVAQGKHSLLNALEDVRIEKATIDANLALNTRRALGALCDSLNVKALAEGYDPNDVKSLGWTLSFLGRCANGYEMDEASVRSRLDPKGEVASVLPWALGELAACKSTQACLDLVDKILAFLNANRAGNPARTNTGKSKPQPQPQPQQEPQEGSEGEPEAQEGKGRAGAQGEPQGEPEGEGEGEGEQGTAQAQGEPQSKPEPQGEGEPAEGEGEPQEGSEGESQGEQGSDSAGNANGSGQGSGTGTKEGEPLTGSDFEEVDLNPNRDEVMKSDQRGFHTQVTLIDALRRGAVLPKKINEISARRDSWGMGPQITSNAARMGKQRALLARALRKAELDDYEGGRISGRLDRRAGSRLIAGSPAVFGRRLLTEGYDTDVEILIDGSSSMQGASARAAATLALVVAQAAAQVGVDCFAHTFSDWGLREVTAGKRKPDAQKFIYAALSPSGGTPLTENMIRAAHLQAARAQGKRRILFVVTDGACDMGTASVKAAGEYLENCMGVEIANLHIGTYDLKAFRNTVVCRAWDVAATGLKSMTDLLEKGA